MSGQKTMGGQTKIVGGRTLAADEAGPCLQAPSAEVLCALSSRTWIDPSHLPERVR